MKVLWHKTIYKMTGAIHTIIFNDGKLLSGSDDMSVGVVTITDNQSLVLSKLLQARLYNSG